MTVTSGSGCFWRAISREISRSKNFADSGRSAWFWGFAIARRTAITMIAGGHPALSHICTRIAVPYQPGGQLA